eukprot:2666624-Lingulodinium_polyedra.AAC.1
MFTTIVAEWAVDTAGCDSILKILAAIILHAWPQLISNKLHTILLQRCQRMHADDFLVVSNEECAAGVVEDSDEKLIQIEVAEEFKAKASAQQLMADV